MALNVYLFLNGRCEEAIEFYKSTLGAEVEMLMRFKDSPDPEQCPPGQEEMIMHATLKAYGSDLMMSDGMGDAPPAFQGFAISIPADSEEAGEQVFNALADGGRIDMPYEQTFWAKRFGYVTDRFGVNWMVSVD